MSTSSPPPESETTKTGKTSSTESLSDQRQGLLFRHDPLSAEERNQLDQQWWDLSPTDGGYCETEIWFSPEQEPDPEMLEWFKANPPMRLTVPSAREMELEQYIRAIRSPIPPSSAALQKTINKFLVEWNRGTYTPTTQLSDDEVWYLRVLNLISFEEALELSPSGRAWKKVPMNTPLTDLQKLRAYWEEKTGRALGEDQLSLTRTGWAQILTQEEYHSAIWGCDPECTLGSSPSTPGTTSTNTPASREPSSSSTNSDSSEPEPGPKRSFVYLAEITGFY